MTHRHRLTRKAEAETADADADADIEAVIEAESSVATPATRAQMFCGHDASDCS
jgi:hypothetical protein